MTDDSSPRVKSRRRRFNYCSWSMCTDPASTRYDMPICDHHAQVIADRVDHIDAKRREHKNRERDDAMIKMLQAENKRLRATILGQKKAKKSEAPTKEPKIGVIYFLKIDGHIKIGWTSDLERRMKKFYPNSQLLAVQPGVTMADERRLHKMFAVHRTHGSEWYAQVPSILHHIEMVRREHGDPPQIVVGAKPVTVPEPRDPQYIGGPSGDPNRPRVLRG